MPKNDSECETYCLLNKNEDFKIDFDKCENLKEIIEELKLSMKLTDVEFQADIV